MEEIVHCKDCIYCKTYERNHEDIYYTCVNDGALWRDVPPDGFCYCGIAREKIEHPKKEHDNLGEAIRELGTNHIELVEKKDGTCYFRIKGSKGKEKSFTSRSFLEWWKQYFEVVAQ